MVVNGTFAISHEGTGHAIYVRYKDNVAGAKGLGMYGLLCVLYL